MTLIAQVKRSTLIYNAQYLGVVLETPSVD
jgi:hypothetical protein